MNQLTDTQVTELVQNELDKARTRYPWWPTDMVKAYAIASEESAEVVKSVNNYYWSHGDDNLADIQAEAIQAIAMLYRFLVETPDMTRDQRAENLAAQLPVQKLPDANDVYAQALLRQAGQAA